MRLQHQPWSKWVNKSKHTHVWFQDRDFLNFYFFVLLDYVIYRIEFIIIICNNYLIIIIFRLTIVNIFIAKQNYNIFYICSKFNIAKNPETYYKKLFLFAPLNQSTHTSWICKSAFLLELPVLYFFTQIDVLYYFISLFLFLYKQSSL